MSLQQTSESIGTLADPAWQVRVAGVVEAEATRATDSGLPYQKSP